VQIPKFPTRFQLALPAASPRPTALFVSFVSMSGLVLTLAAVLSAALGVWRFGADLGWTRHFFIDGGLLSRYQLWLVVAIAAQSSAFILNRWVANQFVDSPALAS